MREGAVSVGILVLMGVVFALIANAWYSTMLFSRFAHEQLRSNQHEQLVRVVAHYALLLCQENDNRLTELLIHGATLKEQFTFPAPYSQHSAMYTISRTSSDYTIEIMIDDHKPRYFVFSRTDDNTWHVNMG